jgi:hypothetical protein
VVVILAVVRAKDEFHFVHVWSTRWVFFNWGIPHGVWDSS